MGRGRKKAGTGKGGGSSNANKLKEEQGQARSTALAAADDAEIERLSGLGFDRELAKDISAYLADEVGLPEVDLGVLFSACEAQSLSRVEVALGRRLGQELVLSPQYRWSWARALQEQAGLALAALDAQEQPDSGNGDPERLPPISDMKRAFQQTKAYAPLEGGWRRLERGKLQDIASTMSKLNAEFPDDREVRNPDSWEVVGRARRVGLAHFDVSDCFGDPAWDAILDSFQRRRPLPTGIQGCARSSSVNFSLMGNLDVPVALVLCNFAGQALSTRSFSPDAGLYLGLDAVGISDWFKRPGHGHRRRARGGYETEYLHLIFMVQCGDSLERWGSRVIRGIAPQDVDHCPLWHFAIMPNFGLALSLEVHCDDGSSSDTGGNAGLLLSLDEELTSAQWNSEIAEGTGFAPLVWLPDNEYLAEAIAPDAVDGAIVMVRRGGGCGFAHKALAVQNAGGVGMIVYEADGDRETMGHVLAMGQTYGGVDYPAPHIPSLLVGAADGKRILQAISALGRSCSWRSWHSCRARIGLERSTEALRRPPRSLEMFRHNARKGEPVHVALLAESMWFSDKRLAEDEEPRAEWFSATKPKPEEDASNFSWVQIATVSVTLQEEEDDLI